MLFITYLYPPLDCGVCRQSKIAKYLPLYGWSPQVVSVRKSSIRPQYDTSLLKDLPPSGSVYRTASLESRILMRGIPRLLHINPKWVQIPDPFVGWLPFAVVKGLDVAEKEKVSAILSTSLPSTCHLAALILKKMTGLPWVADFREAWTQNPFVQYPAAVLKVETRMEAAVMRNADAVTVINDPIREDFEKKYPEQAEKCVTVSHGFDPEDFQHRERSPSKRFTILYAGSLYGKRSSGVFFSVLKDLAENEEVRDDLRVQFVGGVGEAQERVDQLGLSDMVDISGYVSHEKVFSFMVDAHVLLLIIGAEEGGSRISTGKLFEYIGSGTPILALTPEGAAAEVIRKTGAGVVVDPENAEEIKKTVLNLYQKHKRGEPLTTPSEEAILQYDVRRVAERFADILTTLVS